MMSKKRSSTKLPKVTTVRNKVAANPLLSKGGAHTGKRTDERMARSRSRRDLRKLHKAWNGSSGRGNGGNEKENWQRIVGISTVVNSPVLCQFSFSHHSAAVAAVQQGAS